MAADEIVGLLPAFILSPGILRNIPLRYLGKAVATDRTAFGGGGFFTFEDLQHRFGGE